MNNSMAILLGMTIYSLFMASIFKTDFNSQFFLTCLIFLVYKSAEKDK